MIPYGYGLIFAGKPQILNPLCFKHLQADQRFRRILSLYINQINLSKKVYDEMVILVPTKEEIASLETVSEDTTGSINNLHI